MSDDPAFDARQASHGCESLQYQLLSPLIIMVQRVELVTRRIERCPMIADEERQDIQHHLAAFDQAAQLMVQVLDQCRGEKL